ncbi:MAG TPA: hypothetical protein VJ983_09285 [candidate division Zixibacteria bacterium]|nr:hypothetical protein [candidate division Zixibacteria bacterium]
MNNLSDFGFRAAFVVVVVGLLLAGCQVNTLQYVVAPEAEKDTTFSVGQWTLLAPQIVAYRDVRDISTMPHPNLFYLTIRAECNERTYRTTDLAIDSALIEYSTIKPLDSIADLPDGSSYRVMDTSAVSLWRYPTRVQHYNQDGWHHTYGKIYDFFGDQGMPISLWTDSIKLSFNAIQIDSSNGSRQDHPMSITLRRDQRTTTVPFNPR